MALDSQYGKNGESDRVARERAYHDQRFSEETRNAQGKYYSALVACFEEYDRLIDDGVDGACVLEYGCAKGGRSL